MIHCSLSYHKSRVDALPVFAVGVRDGIFDNMAVFMTPPIGEPDFGVLIQNYNDRRGAYENGGLAQKGPYQEAKQALMEGLDALADYVNGVASGDENIILLSGFVPTKGFRSDSPKPVQPTGIVLKRPATGVIAAECANQKVAVNYICMVTVNDPLPSNVVLNENGQLTYTSSDDAPVQDQTDQNASNSADATTITTAYIDFNPGRRKEFRNLQLGSRYYFYFIAANAQGVSTISDGVSMICS